MCGIPMPMLSIEQLPDDPALLKRMLIEQHTRHEAEIQAAVAEAVRKAVQETTAAFMRRFYGPRNERSIRGNCCSSV